jgi:hypothetical protein
MRAPRPKLEGTWIMNRFIYKTNRVFDLDTSRIILLTLFNPIFLLEPAFGTTSNYCFNERPPTIHTRKIGPGLTRITSFRRHHW